jgi:hypothetical protein
VLCAPIGSVCLRVRSAGAMADIGDKYGGAVVGQRLLGGLGLPAADVASTAAVEELLVGPDGVTVLAAHVDASTGLLLWLPAADGVARVQRVVAKSQMTSMLRDTFRNAAYEAAITARVTDFRRRTGRAPVVLDVGAGTGLLSMMAHRAGAAHVYAVEQWAPMAEVARQVTTAYLAGGLRRGPGRQLECGITVLEGHSAAVTVHEGGSGAAVATLPKDGLCMPVRADIVVSEIVDSVLLGEGVLPSLRDAYRRLVALPQPAAPPTVPDAAPQAPCVPMRARLVAQLVHSPLAALWHNTSGCVLPGRGRQVHAVAAATAAMATSAEIGTVTHLARRDWSDTCEWAGVAIPVHAGMLHVVDPSFQFLSAPFDAFLNIDFTPAGPCGPAAAGAEDRDGPSTQHERVSVVPALADADVAANGVFFCGSWTWAPTRMAARWYTRQHPRRRSGRAGRITGCSACCPCRCPCDPAAAQQQLSLSSRTAMTFVCGSA